MKFIASTLISFQQSQMTRPSPDCYLTVSAFQLLQIAVPGTDQTSKHSVLMIDLDSVKNIRTKAVN